MLYSVYYRNEGVAGVDRYVMIVKLLNVIFNMLPIFKRQ
jgi:hypothetical protein